MTPAAYVLPFDSWSYKQNNSDSIICVICRCGEDEHNKGKLIKATAKGVESLRRYCGIRGDDAVKTFLTDEATIVHYHCNCRKEYTNDRVIEQKLKRSASTECLMTTKFLRSSSSSKFAWKQQCFLCAIKLKQPTSCLILPIEYKKFHHVPILDVGKMRMCG